MLWSHLAGGAGLGRLPEGMPDGEVGGIAYDSRRVGPGTIFVAVPGSHRDGHEFIAEALSRGALAVVAEHAPEPAGRGRTVVVPSSRSALAALAASFFGHPSREVPVLGVTGTDGKTTTCSLLQAALDSSMGRAGSLTTVDFRLGPEVEANLTRQTTLESLELQSRMRQMLDRGARALVVESTSHGLALGRLDGIDFEGAVYTNITREHLDFHGTWEAYFEAKAQLLRRSRDRGGFVVLNRDDPLAYQRLLEEAGPRRLSYSSSGAEDADLRAEGVQRTLGGIAFRAHTPLGEADLELAMAGRWNVGNALAALAAGIALEQPLEQLVTGLASTPPVPGRMEPVELGQPFQVVVDYAHTANALTLALHELRPGTVGRLWVVFGSAGERDLGKRVAMGEIAAQLADQIVVTSEDPRGEDPELSVGEIYAAALEAGARAGDNLHREADRKAAIRLAITRAATGDTVLLAGKGHESSIITAQGPQPWSDRGAAEEAIRMRFGG